MSTPPALPWAVRTAPERMLLACTVSAWLAGAVVWAAMAAGFPCWRCTWKAMTGIPCAGCGSTRAFGLLADGHWREALLMNPAAVLGLLVLAGITAYAAMVVLLRMDPWRPPEAVRLHWRWMAVAAFVANWVYLLAAGRA